MSVSLHDLFRTEAETQCAILTRGLLALDEGGDARASLAELMRAAHSLKGAARIVGIPAVADVAHAMEDRFVAAQKGQVRLEAAQIDALLQGVDLLQRIAATPEAEMKRWTQERDEIDARIASFSAAAPAASPTPPPPVEPASEPAAAKSAEPPAPAHEEADDLADRLLRINAESLNRILGLAGESRVESQWLSPFARSLERLKRMQGRLAQSIDLARDAITSLPGAQIAELRVREAQQRGAKCQALLVAQLAELEHFHRRSASLSHRLYGAALDSRLRPFADGAQGFPRMMRDVARTLGKKLRFQLVGEQTPVDRDVLERLEAPLNHMLRNALDHGIEPPAARLAAGKPATGQIRLEAAHSGGLLQVTITDDGAGIDPAAVRRAVIARGLSTPERVAEMREAELFDFLFLPGFSLKEKVTEISGRGVGLDVVRDMLRQLRGTVRLHSEPGRGTTFQLRLPLTLSVLRALLVEIAGEPYGIPLAAIDSTVRLRRDALAQLGGRPHFEHNGARLGLANARRVLEVNGPPTAGGDLAVVVLGEGPRRHGLVVDRFLGERELVVQPLDPRLGKIPDVSSGSLTDTGAPLLVLDVEDLLRSIERLGASDRLGALDETAQAAQRKRVLVVDDSLTVRELMRKVLTAEGYDIELAVDGMDGWNTLRAGDFQLVITDVDMPRMDGIEFIRTIRGDPATKQKPVLIVSYKDREQDRALGLGAGADAYLGKGGFSDESLVQTVRDLIGAP